MREEELTAKAVWKTWWVPPEVDCVTVVERVLSNVLCIYRDFELKKCSLIHKIYARSKKE